MFIHYVASILLLIGIVEASAQCPSGAAPTLNPGEIGVVNIGNTIIITGAPEWGDCVPIRRGSAMPHY
jgi:hypothetical protein